MYAQGGAGQGDRELCECREWIGVGHTMENVGGVEVLGVENWVGD